MHLQPARVDLTAYKNALMLNTSARGSTRVVTTGSGFVGNDSDVRTPRRLAPIGVHRKRCPILSADSKNETSALYNDSRSKMLVSFPDF